MNAQAPFRTLAPKLRNSTQRRQPKNGFSLALRAVCDLPPPRSFASFLSTASCLPQNSGFQNGQNSPRPSVRVINSPAADLPRWLWQGRLALAARPGRPCHIAFYALTGQNACKMRVSRGLSPPCHLVKSRQTSVKNDTYKSPAKFLQNRRRSERESNRRPEATRGRFAAPAQKPPLHGTRSLHIQFALQKIIGQSDGSRP